MTDSPFELVDVLGRGRFASVHIAREPETGRLVAVKVFKPAPGDPDGSAAVQSEVEILSSLPPGVGPALFSWGKDFLVLEYIEGRDLSRLGPAPPDLASDIAVELASALEKIHNAGIVHGDLAPSHVVLTPDGSVRLLDFGLAHPRGRRPRTPEGGAGTPAYISPEAASGRFGDPRSDLYAAGAVLYELLAGTPPFVGLESGDALKARGERLPEPPSRSTPATPPALDRLVLKLLRPDPAQRYPDASAFKKAARDVANAPDVERLRRDDAAAYLLSPQFQGREREIEEVLQLLLNGGLEGLFLLDVRAEPGMGKTRFLEETARVLEAAGAGVRALPPGEEPSRGRVHAGNKKNVPPVYILDAISERSSRSVEAASAFLDERSPGPALLLCASRPSAYADDVLARLAGRKRPTPQRVLGPLTSPQMGRLVRSMVGFAPLPPGLEEAVASASRGNPGMAEALVRDLAASGRLSRPGGTWTLEGPLPDPLPCGREAARLLAATASTRGEAIRRVLEAVAVLAEDPDPVRVRKITGLRRGEFEKAIRTARQEGYLSPGPPLAFAGPALARAFWEGLPPEDREALHASAAGTLKWDRSPQGLASRGRHLVRAGRGEEGARVLLDAAGKALQAGGSEDASAWIREAFSVQGASEDLKRDLRRARERLGAPDAGAPAPADPASVAPPSPGQEPAEAKDLDRSRIGLLLVLAGAYVREGRFPSAEETLGTALLEGEKAGRPDILARAHLMLGGLNLDRRNLRAALKNLLKAASHAPGDDASLVAEIRLRIASARLETGDASQALGEALRARELAGRGNAPHVREALTALEAEIAAMTGDPGRALSNLGRTLRRARSLGHETRGVVRRSVGRVFRTAGDLPRARRYLSAASRSFERAGKRLNALEAQLHAALCAALESDLLRAKEGLASAGSLFGVVPAGSLRRLASTAGALATLGDPSVSADLLAEGAKAGSGPEDDPRGWGLFLQAEAAQRFASGDADGGLQRAREVLDLLDREAFVLDRAHAAAFLSSAARRAPGLAAEQAEEAARWARQASETLAGAGLAEPAGRARVEARRLLEASGPVREAEADAGAEAPSDAAGDAPEGGGGGSSLEALWSVSRSINSELELSKLIPLIMDRAIETMEAERGFLLLDRGEAGLAVEVARGAGGADVDEPSVEVSRTIAEEVVRRGQAVLTSDAGADERFSEQRSVTGLRLRSVLCVPLKNRGRTLGAVYVEDRTRAGAFGPAAMDFLSAFADQAAVALENARLYEDLRSKTRELEASKREVEALNEALKERVDRQAVEISDLSRRMEAERLQAEARYDYANIVGSSAPMREVFRLMDRAVESEVPVLIVGESGTGKELVARAIHHHGARKGRPFAVESCAALSESLLESELFGHVRGAFTGAVEDKKGLFELADGGTLFLDEVGEMSPGLQSKLLRALQEGEVRPVGGKTVRTVDVRFIYASNRDLRAMVSEGTFREDLFYRINVLTIALPPLRERIEDIPLLAAHFLEQGLAGEGASLSPASLKRLTAHAWPGNVRELENEIKRAGALSDGEIRPEHLSESLPAAGTDAKAGAEAEGTLKDRVEALEIRMIRNALARREGNRTRAAGDLGISRYGLLKKMKRYGIP